ncbi:hypothetical protein [Pelosinus sp. sgz500959]|uniref:hypothetical protein n=1 Tax=Pelosinus sp. sgz500959 TaxID=3242472 RepID=UPI00366DAD43
MVIINIIKLLTTNNKESYHSFKVVLRFFKKGVINIKTLSQIAEELNTPSSTLRYRITPYMDFLPCVRADKGKMLYADDKKEIMREINTYASQGRGNKEITKILLKKYPHNAALPKDQKLGNNEEIMLPMEEENTNIIATQNTTQEINESVLINHPIQQESGNNVALIEKLAEQTKILKIITDIPNIEKYLGYVLYEEAKKVI